MREFVAIFSPQWWTFKNRLFRSDRAAYVKSVFILLLGAGFWFVALHFLGTLLTKLQGLEGNVGNIIVLKGLSLILMLVFFLLIFSSLLVSINIFFLSPDLQFILASPVSWSNIYLSKWLETAVKASWMILFAILPLLIALGMFYKVPADYYFLLLFVLVTFVLIPSGLGVCTSIFIMAIMPAKRARNIFAVLGLLIIIIISLLFRLLKPERFANPEWFANLTIFISEMKLPASVVLPSTWAAEILTPYFSARAGSPLFFILLLLFTACVFNIFGNWMFNAFYYKGLLKAQQSQRPRLMLPFRVPLFFFRGYRKALIEKDIATFVRNIGQSSQVLLLFAIVIIYLFSIKALPVDWGTSLSFKLKYVISFLNIGLVGFVITAVAARLVLPSVGNEGRSFWIIRVSPVSIRQFLWNKFFAAFFPLFILAQTLVVISNVFLGVKIWFTVLSIGTCSVLVASITGLAVGIGAYNAKFSLEDASKEQSGFQGAAFMLSAFAVIILTIMLEIIPAVGIFMKDISKADLTYNGMLIISLLFLLVLVLNSGILWAAMRTGEKRLVSIE